MTRKVFNKKRYALTLAINDHFKGTAAENKHIGQSLKAQRPVSGKTLIPFDSPYIIGNSYQEVWDSLKDMRNLVGMA